MLLAALEYDGAQRTNSDLCALVATGSGCAWFFVQLALKASCAGITGSPEHGGHRLAIRVDDRLDQVLSGLQEFSTTLRSAYDLLQLRDREHERDRDDRFQRNIAIGGAVILIPTLVAGIMGANTWVPRTMAGPPPTIARAFALLLGVMLASAVLAWAAIHWLQRRDDRTS